MNSEHIMSAFPHTTLNAFPDQVLNILLNLEEVLNNGIEGEVVELGCHAGLTSIYIRRLLDTMKSNKEFHVYDSFEGLPEKKKEDKAEGWQNDKFVRGYFDLKGTWQLIQRFKDNERELPIIHEGWFKGQEYPNKIAFGFLDGDFYESIMDSLEKVWPRLQSGGIICIHDYGWDQLPGVKQAVEEYFGKLDMVEVPTFGLAVIKKQ